MAPLPGARALADRCFFAAALEFLEAAPPAETSSREGLLLRGRLLVQLGKAREAEKLFLKIPVSPDKEKEAERLLLLALAQATDKRRDEASRTAREALAHGADQDLIDGLLGMAQAKTGHPKEAEATLRRVLRRDPVLTGALYNLACIRAMAGDVAESAALIRFAWTLGYKDPDRLRTDPWLEAVRSKTGLVDDLLKSDEHECKTW
jgi:tetratricopeptide (TPR) repeat protein